MFATQSNQIGRLLINEMFNGTQIYSAVCRSVFCKYPIILHGKNSIAVRAHYLNVLLKRQELYLTIKMDDMNFQQAPFNNIIVFYHVQ